MYDKDISVVTPTIHVTVFNVELKFCANLNFSVSSPVLESDQFDD